MLLVSTPVALSAYTSAAVLAGIVAYRFRHIVLRGIPELSAPALGLYRIVLGCGLFWLMAVALRLPDTAASGGSEAEAAIWDPWPWVEHLAAHPELRDALQMATLVVICAFTVGLYARAAYLLVVAGFVVCLLVAQEYGVGSHAWVLFPLILVPLCVVPWGDGLSMDSLVRRWRGHPARARPPGVHYGIAVWMPGLVLGCVWAAAAAAKIGKTNWEWITSGAVRYHWAEDHLVAPSSWGGSLAGHEILAIALSAAAVGIEALFITHVLFRSEWVRLAYGLVGISLLFGFYVFQGLFWYAWWIPLLAFVPWVAIVNLAQRATKHAPSALPASRLATRPTKRWYASVAAIVAAVSVQQLAVSRAGIEQMPFLSSYTMYSNTWPSAAAFNKAVAPTKFYRYQIFRVSRERAVTDITRPLRVAGLDSPLRDAAAWSGRYPGRRLGSSMQQALVDARSAYKQLLGVPVRRVRVVTHARVFDFGSGRLVAVPSPAAVEIKIGESEVTLTRPTLLVGRRRA